VPGVILRGQGLHLQELSVGARECGQPPLSLRGQFASTGRSIHGQDERKARRRHAKAGIEFLHEQEEGVVLGPRPSQDNMEQLIDINEDVIKRVLSRRLRNRVHGMRKLRLEPRTKALDSKQARCRCRWRGGGKQKRPTGTTACQYKYT
jgi:hypothetical protein